MNVVRYGIFSDIHSNLEAFEAVITAFADESIDQYLCAGDIVGYAANPNECCRRVWDLQAQTVAGNHDLAATGAYPLDYFNHDAKISLQWTAEKLDDEVKEFLSGRKLVLRGDDFTLVHGTLYEPHEFRYMHDYSEVDFSFRLLETQVCFIGHSHRPGVFIEHKNTRITYHEMEEQDDPVPLEKGNKYIINVGSVGQPRDGNPDASYCVYDTGTSVATIRRVAYNIPETHRKILAAGLPQKLADRLLTGS